MISRPIGYDKNHIYVKYWAKFVCDSLGVLVDMTHIYFIQLILMKVSMHNLRDLSGFSTTSSIKWFILNVVWNLSLIFNGIFIVFKVLGMGPYFNLILQISEKHPKPINIFLFCS